MAMCWNQQKFNNLAISLTRRYQKTTKALQSQLQNLESMKAQLTVTARQFEVWVNDVKEWADAATTTTNDADALASRIEVLVASIKRCSQCLYKDTDGNKGCARICRKIREEKGILTYVVEKYNRMVKITETLCLETILSGETAWPWQLPHSDSVNLRTKRRAFEILAWGGVEDSCCRDGPPLEIFQLVLIASRELSCLFSSETMKSMYL
ncbi:hypothetical protein PO909_023472 [Leuciscus waleckii]